MTRARLRTGAFLTLLFSGMLLASCSKDNITINIGNTENGENNSSGSGNGGGTSTDSTKTGTLFFNADVLSMITKAGSVTPIATNRYVTIYAYNNGNFVKSKMYSSQNAGTLTPLEAPDLSLNVGNYSLYAPGNNSEGKAVPVFTGTTYSNLQNNNDYIWWTKNITVAGSSETIDMTLDHCCSQILVKLNASGDAVKGVTTMTLTPSSTQNSPWDLTTGVITPATALTAAMNMGITQKSDTLYYGQLIMMPLNATASSDSLTINIGVTYASGTQNYTAKLPVYKANSGASPAFKPGICYIYNLSISASGITIQTVDVTNWVDVTVNNEPIIPSQV